MDVHPKNTDIEALLKAMTLEEKALLCSGRDFWNTKPIPRLGIPSISMADGPHGLRKQKKSVGGHAISDNVPATCFPTAVTLASTWNTELVGQVGKAIGEEARFNDVDIVLGPGVNIKRSPLGGRNFEYFSEDPYLAGKLASSFVTGLQSTETGACLKHFAANNQETRRLVIDALIDQKTLHEIYLKPFEIAVKEAAPWTVMSAYNKLNGKHCCESSFLLEETLRGSWGFEGLAMSDWGAVNDRVESVRAGMDLEMPGYEGDGEKQIIDAVRDGRLSIEDLDNCARRVLQLIERCSSAKRDKVAELREEHRTIAERAATEGVVLLKNECNLLPLKRKGTIAIIGEFAKKPRYQGAGSSLVTPYSMENAYAAFLSKAGDGLEVLFAPGYKEGDLKPDRALLGEAKATAGKADIAVIFCGLPAILETEGIDRQDLRMPESHERLIEEVLSVNRNVVAVLMNGGPLEMPWSGAVPCILEAYLGGQAGGRALARILFGEESPSGKLAETFPGRWDDNPAGRYFPGGRESVEYREGNLVGYRYYDAAGSDVLFPFGHGLSYTEFSYEGLSFKEETAEGRWWLDVGFTLSNKGTCQGKEVVQVYVRRMDDSPSKTQEKNLGAFVKVDLSPGESMSVGLSVDEREFSTWSAKEGCWIADGGAYEILVGSSSRDIRLKEIIDIGGLPKREAHEESAPDYFGALAEGDMGKKAFEAILGTKVPSENKVKRGSYTLDTPLCDMEGVLAALLRFMLSAAARIVMVGNRDNPTVAATGRIVMEAPLRKFTFFTNGAVKRPFLEGLLALLNFRLI